MKFSKAQKFALAVLGSIGLILVWAWHTGTVVWSWSDLFNGTVQTVLGTFVTMAATIWVYRYLYHRKSKT